LGHYYIAIVVRLHPALLALAIITVGRFQAVILVNSIAILIEGLVLSIHSCVSAPMER
jgi:hypothetical protein